MAKFNQQNESKLDINHYRILAQEAFDGGNIFIAKTHMEQAVLLAQSIWDFDQIAQDIAADYFLNDKKWATIVFREAIKKAETLHAFETIAEHIADTQLLNNKVWARQIFKFAEQHAFSFQDFMSMAQSIADETLLNDKIWARTLFNKAIDKAMNWYDFKEVAEKISDNCYLNDTVLGEQLYKKAARMANKATDLQQIIDSIYQVEDLEHLANFLKTDLVNYPDYGIVAARLGDITALKQLADKAYNFNIQDKNGRTPLMWACAKGQNQAVDFLLNHGVDVTITATNKETALITALTNAEGLGHINNQLIIRLLSLGSPLNTQTRKTTALMAAIENKNLVIVKVLLELGANPNVQLHTSKDSALHIAVENQQICLIKYLLKADANPNLKNAFRLSPLDIAKENNLPIITALLEAKNR